MQITPLRERKTRAGLVIVQLLVVACLRERVHRLPAGQQLSHSNTLRHGVDLIAGYSARREIPEKVTERRRGHADR